MKLILKAYTKQSELLFELVQDADVSIGILIIIESDQGSISGGVCLVRIILDISGFALNGWLTMTSLRFF